MNSLRYVIWSTYMHCTWLILKDEFIQYKLLEKVQWKIQIKIKKEGVFVTKTNSLIPISLLSDGINLWYFKLRLFGLTEWQECCQAIYVCKFKKKHKCKVL